ncbi:MAG: crotonase/enoyl-CoA hydratase family protein [Deltaproteobacteria bacterium]|nr:crotonase/enoyl-CoA hydratase family protein [Deltaproteobacteria bacterium]MBW2384382.1 crotonase/enoyl-CoA hydratase family protein [Deltaproteobacteria bacterium]MBW2698343.1 crotonase/enoyl-CoA hydratase family protein [Deltaproteobacteria bacterium]
MSDRVTIDIQDGVADVRLNRPEKMNALDQAMFRGLAEAAAQLADDRSVRAVVLSGEGRAFCAGLDMASFAAMAGDAPASGAERAEEKKRPADAGGLLAKGGDGPANFAQAAGWAWRELPVPVIAAVHGVAYGGGLQVALGADIRVVAPDARLSVLEIKWGLVPDMSGTQTLRHLVRDDIARDLTFTGRVVSGQEAVEIGLATRVHDDPRTLALEMAREIAQKSPDAIRAGKQLLGEARTISVEDGLRLEARLQAGLIGQPNQVEAIRANMEKRAPNFADPE